MNAMFAYIDAGTGSLLLQGVVAGLFTVILFFRQISSGCAACCMAKQQNEMTSERLKNLPV